MMRTTEKLRASLNAFWSQRDQRERRLLRSASVIIVLVLIYLVGINPALQGRTRLQKELPNLRQQSAQLQALIVKAAALPPPQTPGTAPPPKEGLTALLSSKGLKPQSIAVSGDSAKLTFSGIAFSALFDWLNEAQKTEHWKVVDASINASGGATTQPDSVNATVTLSRQSNE
ncbi:type II secretion system protein GspM [Glaciimonas sp. PCH181]|uniref:type II secretion system protein GspM n=1 Tax=Glaciimonas sp. PCH181 TaxID=2133943 RepID=UPI000D3D89E2|nr:type II secretion system protein GspM [Glaciimonas sp. PCH181]PUA20204.1 general secretion pathway protein GspM [Glaciimonas sp. PCH181]